MKFVVIAAFIAIVGSLLSGLVFLVKDKGQTDRTVRALTVRIALSVALFLVLMLGFWLGLIPGKIQ
jgi:hypothetical protein